MFAVVKYYVEFIGMRNVAWAKVEDPRANIDWHPLTPKQARDLIKKHDMVRVADTRDGRIYDTPDLAWTKRWKGIFNQSKHLFNEQINETEPRG